MEIGIVSLSGCSGCQMALVDHKELFSKILNEIKFATTLFDQKELPKLDFCLVEGAVRTTEDLEKLVEARKKAKVLVSIGSCSVYGGIQSLGNLFQSEEILSIVSNDATENPFTETPQLNARVQPLDHHVNVDFFIPGCPPSASVLEESFKQIFLGEKTVDERKHRLPICAECGRKIEHYDLADFEKISVPDPEICLLSQGYICLGSVTRSGCGAQCPTFNTPCSGCRGPTDSVLTKPTHYVLRDFVKRVAHFTGKSEKEVKEKIIAIPWRFYPFTFASQALRNKPHSKILELQAPLIDKE